MSKKVIRASRVSPPAQAWIRLLQPKFNTISRFCCGHTRSSRLVSPIRAASG